MNQDERPRMGNGWPFASTSTRPSSDGLDRKAAPSASAVSDAPRRTHQMRRAGVADRSSVHSEGHVRECGDSGRDKFPFVPRSSRQGSRTETYPDPNPRRLRLLHDEADLCRPSLAVADDRMLRPLSSGQCSARIAGCGSHLASVDRPGESRALPAPSARSGTAWNSVRSVGSIRKTVPSAGLVTCKLVAARRSTCRVEARRRR